MAKTIARDAEMVHQALAGQGDPVELSVSRETAKLLARVVGARARGEHVLVTE